MKDETIITLLLIITIIPRLFFLQPTNADEVFHYNVGKQIMLGKTPYKDFFYAHPPVQATILALLFKTFGATIAVAKILPLTTSALTVVLSYLVAKHEYGQKTGVVAALMTLLSAEWLAFSLISNGFYTAIMFALAALHASQKKKYWLSGTLLTLSAYTRVSIVMVFPILYLHDKKIVKSTKSFLTTSLILLVFLQVTTQNFLTHNFAYHFATKFAEPNPSNMQFWSMGFFFLGQTLVASFYNWKNRKELLKTILPFMLSLAILFTFWRTFYYYMAPFTTLLYVPLARVFRKEKDAKIILTIMILVSLYHNWITISFHNTPNPIFQETSNFFEDRNGTVFGYPIIMNYASFKHDTSVAFQFYDSYFQHVYFNKTIVSLLEDNPPKYFVTSASQANSYYNQTFQELIQNYVIVREFGDVFNYQIRELNASSTLE